MNRDEFLEKLRIVSPGTPLRFALDQIVAANTGALIFFVDDFEKYSSLMQPGFLINCEFNPNKLYELTKMDGAIVIDENLNRIIAANVQLIPDPSISSTETGMRHRTAERMARQTGKMLVAISKRKRTISLFYDDYSYMLRSLELLIPRINQAVGTVDQYRKAFDKGLEEIDVLESTSVLTLYDVIRTLHKGLMILRIYKDEEMTLAELGNYGDIPKMQFEEILSGVTEEIENLVLDFSSKILDTEEINTLTEKLFSLSEKEMSNYVLLAKLMGYEVSSTAQTMEMSLFSRGIRFIRKIPKIPLQVALNIGKRFGSLSKLMDSSSEELKEVEGIGEKRALAIRHAIDVKKRHEDID
ncbi:DNA integrity scanning protein DisA [Kosmotoga arenicorallina S304]|uniref:DNA integrity scanning protein DisA n=1 Tax=Kosmotoga arenicorallina S304 TaxID=1453497 RepID=A0A176K011_9BACT|nr:DNA integrity scanning diadenylate cyclase DisA [Kosmotoga arenicorallina]OAA29752.1 DNA integrity scanning protein DisA [Kosmotoga arenicorallina S304]